MVFRPSLSISLMQFGLGGKIPWKEQLQVDLFNLIYRPVLSIPQLSLAWGQAYVGAATAGLVFRPNLLVSLMKFGLWTNAPWE